MPARKSLDSLVSRCAVGSSAITTDGRFTSARAMATRWASPPESHSTRESAFPDRSNCPSNSRARRRMAARGSPVVRAGSMTFSTALIPRMRWNCWKMNPKVLRRMWVRNRSGRLVISCRSTIDAAGGRLGHAADDAEQRGLARAARALEHGHLDRLDEQAHALERRELVRPPAVEDLGDGLELDHSRARPGHCRMMRSGSTVAAFQDGTTVATV